MMHEHGHRCFHKCFSWTAVFSGALVGIGLSFLLNIFSVAIGLSIFSTSNGVMSLAVGGFIGLIIGIIVSMFVSGWVAGYLGRPFCFKRNLGILYGFVTWCLALIITILLMSYVGRYITSFSNAISNPTMIIVAAEENTPSTQSTGGRAMQMTATKAVNTVGFTTFIVFVLFFIGAISACTGAAYGMSYKDECAPDEKSR